MLGVRRLGQSKDDEMPYMGGRVVVELVVVEHVEHPGNCQAALSPVAPPGVIPDCHVHLSLASQVLRQRSAFPKIK
jgi:hypothetical protein